MASTTVGAAGYSSPSPAQYDPAFTMPHPIRIWGNTGNTDTVIDATVTPRSVILVNPTTAGGIPPNGFWQILTSNGQFVITSTDSESAGLTYNYRIL